MNLKIDYRRTFKGITWLALGLAFIVLSAASIANNQTKSVKEVIYKLDHLTDGNDLITVDELKKKVFATYDIDMVGMDVGQLDLIDLEYVLQEEAFIVEADAYLDAQSKLHIDIAQRTPILRVMDLQGNNYYLDCEGVKLPLSKHFTARVPIVFGAVSPYQQHIDSTDGTLRAAFDIIKAARADDFLMAWLDGIRISSNQEILLSGSVGKFEVIFGAGDQIQEKFEKMKLFFKKGLPVTGWSDLESINLKYANQVITKSRAKT